MVAFNGNLGPWEILILLYLFLYLLPSFIAYRHSKTNFQLILAVNLLLGWTVIGWIISLIWSLTEVSKD